MPSPKQLVARTARRIAGENSTPERFVRQQAMALKLRTRGMARTRNFIVFTTGRPDAGILGIYGRGSCDMPTVMKTAPAISKHFEGTVVIAREGLAADSRSDILLQKLEGIPEELTREVVERLRLPETYFQPEFFEPTFRISGYENLGEFPKSVVILSIATDFSRTAYRHREHGYLVDPGGWWLAQSLDKVLQRLDETKWFAKHFEKAGKITVEEFSDNFDRIIRLVRERAGAEVVVMNTLSVDPGNPMFDYKLSDGRLIIRRREFNLALVELSRRLDFAIIDIDRILKGEGISEQADFAHFSNRQKEPVAKEIFRVFRERRVV